ncbi:kinase-like protein [Hysterangium stoloniferum]|nr:kinase-like protein [Hysterangium stoloniferum]
MSTAAVVSSHGHGSTTPTLKRKSSAGLQKAGKGQRITLTSKHNWWLIDVEDDAERNPPPSHSHPPAVKPITIERPPVDVSPPHFHQPLHPSSIFAHPPSSPFIPAPPPFPFPAPQHPTAHLAPIATGSTSELFKCIVKKPDILQIEINGEMQTNANDVMAQFLAELRVYSTIQFHRNFPAYLGSLDDVGMVLEFIEGRSLLDVLRAGQLDKRTKIDMHDQLLDGLTYLHSFGLSHGDLSLLNVLVTRTNTLKILDFGRSTSINSTFISPSDPPPEPDFSVFAPPPAAHSASQAFAFPSRSNSRTITLQLGASPSASPTLTPRLKIEQIHPGTRPFTAPEILRAQCTDPLLADAYSFGMILYCIDLGGLVDVDQKSQMRAEMPPGVDECDVFGERIAEYLKVVEERRRLMREDFMAREA